MSKRDTILVIEDEPSLQALLRFQLEPAGYEVEVVGDGEAGLEAVARRRPDLILMDVMMPKMDGTEVCRRLKSDPRTAQIPIIMLTAKSELEDKIRGFEDGANDFITKPYERKELLGRVRNLLHWGRLQRDANPLTGLPGNQSIDEELLRRISRREDFVFMYVDVDQFKAFNDFYSYRRGDDALRRTASILQQATASLGVPDDFVGHVGGDDFILILNEDAAPLIGDEILRRFDEEIPALYSQTDRARGFIQVAGRQGEVTKFPLMTLTIAAVSNRNHRFGHVAQVCDVAAELKQLGKLQNKSVIIWDRRAA